jgi:hypothetical protein
MADKPKRTAIRIEDSKDVRINNNTAHGYDELLAARNVEGLSAKGNRADVAPPGPSWFRQHLTELVILIVAGLVVAWLAWKFGLAGA